MDLQIFSLSCQEIKLKLEDTITSAAWVFWQGVKPPLFDCECFEIQGRKHRGTMVGIYEDGATSI